MLQGAVSCMYTVHCDRIVCGLLQSALSTFFLSSDYLYVITSDLRCIFSIAKSYKQQGSHPLKSQMSSRHTSIFLSSTKSCLVM